MAEAKTPLAAIHEAFDAARGEEMDGVWAFAVSWSLMMRDVGADLVRDGLEEALEVVDQTQQSPEQLFGTAGEHAGVLYDQWLAEGRLVLVDSTHQTWPEAIRLGVGLSAAYAVVFVVVLLVRGDLDQQSTVWFLLISLAIGMGTDLGLALWSRRHRRSRRATDVTEDARWSVELTEILRTRYSLSAPRVRAIVTDAHTHAAEARSTVREEFGTPQEYAAGFAPDLARRSRWTAALLAVLACLSLVLTLDGFSWATTALGLLFGWRAWREYSRHRTLQQAPDH